MVVENLCKKLFSNNLDFIIRRPIIILYVPVLIQVTSCTATTEQQARNASKLKHNMMQ